MACYDFCINIALCITAFKKDSFSHERDSEKLDNNKLSVVHENTNYQTEEQSISAKAALLIRRQYRATERAHTDGIAASSFFKMLQRKLVA